MTGVEAGATARVHVDDTRIIHRYRYIIFSFFPNLVGYSFSVKMVFLFSIDKFSLFLSNNLCQNSIFSM
jgi:hypothetical protein